MDWLEITAAAFGVLAVWFVVRQSIWCWPTGLIQVTLFVPVFFTARLYSDAILHVIYIVIQIYGWYHWLHGGAEKRELPVSALSARALSFWALVTVAGTGLWGYVIASNTDASVPYGDAFTTVASLAAMWLMARKNIENWYFWIAVDVIAIGIYYHKALIPTAILYIIFLVLSIVGLRSWQRSIRDRERCEATVPA